MDREDRMEPLKLEFSFNQSIYCPVTDYTCTIPLKRTPLLFYTAMSSVIAFRNELPLVGSVGSELLCERVGNTYTNRGEKTILVNDRNLYQ